MKKITFLMLALLMAVVGIQAENIIYLDQLKDGKTYTLQHGDVLTGTLYVNATLKIANNAEITLRNACISFDNYLGKSINYTDVHSGIHTNGNATILLEGSNYVHPFGSCPPGIFVAKGYTLTIDEPQGKTGKLRAWSPKGAGIGAGWKKWKNILSAIKAMNSCGNITIRNGFVEAYSDGGAGIGGGYETSCGKITITGGNVLAVGFHGAGIGSGVHNTSNGSDYWSDCEGIEISGGSVQAESSHGCGIGAGRDGRMSGKITITDGVRSIYAVSRTSYGASIGKYDNGVFGGLTLFGENYPNGLATLIYEYPKTTTPTPEPEPECNKPTNVTPSDISAYGAKISWKAGSGNGNATYYVRYYPTSDDSHFNEVKVVGQTSAWLENLTPKQSYRAYVVCECSKGVISDPSSDVTFTTTAAPAPAASDQIYSVYNDGVLTYYYDSKMSSRAGTKEVYDPDKIRFQDYAENVESAFIDKSVGKANPTTLKNFFYGGRGDCSLKNMTNIYGLENIEMYDVTDMSYMFCNCESLIGLDLSQFNTLYVKNMNAMFYGCEDLEELNIYMFEFNSLESMRNMFYGCRSLRTIYCNRDLSYLGNQGAVFTGCGALRGGKGTTYSSAMVGIEYARPDQGSNGQGYFTNYTCPQVQNIQATEVTSHSAVITWDVADMYQYAWLVYYTDPNRVWKTVSTKENSALITNLEPNTEYRIDITGDCGSYGFDPMSSMMASITFTTSAPEGIEEVMSNDAWRDGKKVIIDGHLYIRVNDKLYDATGKEVR